MPAESLPQQQAPVLSQEEDEVLGDGEGTEMVLHEADLQNASILLEGETIDTAAVMSEAAPDEQPEPMIMEEPQQEQQQRDVMALALQKKEEGNALFGQQQFQQASAAYLEGLEALSSIALVDEAGEIAEESSSSSAVVVELQVSLRSNLAQAYLKLEDFEQADHHCTVVINDINPNVPKVWYRRALAREGLAKQHTLSATSSTTSSPPEMLQAALNDVDQCVRLLKAQDKMVDKGTLRLRDKLQKLWQSWEEQQQQLRKEELPPKHDTQVGSAVTMNGHSNHNYSPASQMNHHHHRRHHEQQQQHDPSNSTTIDGTSVDNILSTPPPNRPAPEQQRKDVMKLLISRSVGLQRASQEEKDAALASGEALFLMDWKWWCQWCRHVDFFHQREEPQQQSSNNNKRSWSHKSETILKLLPPGAILPHVPVKKKDKDTNKNNDNDDEETSTDNSTDSEDEDQDHDFPPGPVDNSALFLLPHSSSATHKNGFSNNNNGAIMSTQTRFYQQWYGHLRPVKDNSSTVHCNGDNNTNAKGCVDRAESFQQVCLRPNLVRGFHYEILPREVYCALKSWYREITPSICRRTTYYNNDKGHPIVSIDLYPLSPMTLSTSSSSPVVATTKARPSCAACRAKHATQNCTRCRSVTYCGKSCQESHWPYHKLICSKIASSKNNNDSNGDDAPDNNINFTSSEGRVGLNNVGNTCFMNSALQCLSHATPLTRHFLSNQYKNDLNISNPLGTGGKLAHAFDAVLKELWLKPNIRSTSPTALKRAIALFAPRFAGCLQHDSQEFLAYLLDGLHEDLNRIRSAPYVEMPDADVHGENMGVAGAEAWECHLRRNDSLVMDTFYGQFKSTCVCPNASCGRVSVSFDAFNHVSLEIPQLQRTTRWIPVFFFPTPRINQPSIVRYAFCLNRGGLIADLRAALSQSTGIPMTNLLLCECNGHTIHDILTDRKPLAHIRSDEIVTAYQVDPWTATSVHVVANQILLDPGAPEGIRDEEKSNAEYGRYFGFPFLLSGDANMTCRQLWDKVWKQVRRMVVPLNENGEEEEIDVEMEDVYRQLVNIRVTQNDSSPRAVFPLPLTDKEQAQAQSEEQKNGEDETQIPLTSYLPRFSDEQLSTFLGEDSQHLLFVSLEWNESMPVPPEILKNAANSNGSTGHTNNKKKKKTKKSNKVKQIPKIVGIEEERFLAHENHSTYIEGLRKESEENGARGISLDQCFETFTKPERLDEQNMWYCSNCKQHVRALKTMELWRLPNILVVHLKRFEFRNSYRRDKLTTLVDFPLDGLDMSKHCSRWRKGTDGQDDSLPEQLYIKDNIPAVYDLFAVINHFGRLGFGHYTAFARQWDEEGLSSDWALFDDASVRSVGDGRGGTPGVDGVVSSAAYVLFYRRRTFG